MEQILLYLPKQVLDFDTEFCKTIDQKSKIYSSDLSQQVLKISRVLEEALHLMNYFSKTT